MRKTVLLAILASHAVQAKIADADGLVDGNVLYESHADYVEATDTRTHKRLWHTDIDDHRDDGPIDPRMEQDVQWNIAYVLYYTDTEVVAEDSRWHLFRLDKVTGRLKGKFVWRACDPAVRRTAASHAYAAETKLREGRVSFGLGDAERGARICTEGMPEINAAWRSGVFDADASDAASAGTGKPDSQGQIKGAGAKSCELLGARIDEFLGRALQAVPPR